MRKKPLSASDHPDIKITKAVCAAFGTGFCYGACGRFYSGHYETFEQALAAAVTTKRTTCDAVRSDPDA